MHADFHSVRRALQNDLYGFVLVLTIAMKHCVSNGFAYSHVDPERSIIADA